MGDAAVGEVADDRQIAEMCRLLAASIDGGGLGFSSSLAATHHDNDGNPVPSRFAAPAELLALADAEDRAAWGDLPLSYIETWGTPKLRAARSDDESDRAPSRPFHTCLGGVSHLLVTTRIHRRGGLA